MKFLRIINLFANIVMGVMFIILTWYLIRDISQPPYVFQAILGSFIIFKLTYALIKFLKKKKES